MATWETDIRDSFSQITESSVHTLDAEAVVAKNPPLHNKKWTRVGINWE